jgi:hypothetical protein
MDFWRDHSALQYRGREGLKTKCPAKRPGITP